MKPFHKLFTAVCLIAITAVVGCGNPKTADEDKTKTKTEKTHSHSHDETPGKTMDGKTGVKTTDQMPTIPAPTPDENPDVQPTDNPPPKAESGSSEKKGGVPVPDGDGAPAQAESGSSDN